MLLGWRLEGGDPCEEPFWSRGWEWRRWQVELDGFVSVTWVDPETLDRPVERRAALARFLADNARYHAAMTDTPPTDQPLRPGAAVDGVPLSRIIRPDRHKSVMDVYEWFEYGHLRNNLAREVSADFHELATMLLDQLPDSAELTNALRRLLEAKDSAVRAAIKATR